MENNKTEVIFLIDKPEGSLSCSVFAFFPKERYNGEDGLFMSYARIGQHSACHIDYAKECKEATENRYFELLQELTNNGYDNLFIINKN